MTNRSVATEEEEKNKFRISLMPTQCTLMTVFRVGSCL
jgi:hypothetical protein